MVYRESFFNEGFACEYDELGNRLFSIDIKEWKKIQNRNNIINSILEE